MNGLITVARWSARLIAVLALLLFGLLFLQDGLPLFMFAGESFAMTFHMWALLAMLVSLGLGWKWEGAAASLTLGFFLADMIGLLVYGLSLGGEEGWVFALAGFSFPFVLFPLGGVFFLVSWLWRRKRVAARL